MDILAIAGIILRRWYITVPIVLLGLGVAYYVEQNTPPMHQATGSVMLAAPDLDPSRLPLTVTDLDELLRQVESEAAEGNLGEGTVDTRRVDGATVEIVVGGPTGEVAWATFESVRDDFAERLRAFQEGRGLPADERTEVLTESTEFFGLEEGEEAAFADPDAGQAELGDEEEQPEGTSEDEVTVVARLVLSDPTAVINNPYGPSAQTARVLEVALSSDEGRSQIRDAAGREVLYLLSGGGRDVAPLMEIYTFASAPDIAIADFDVIVQALASELDSRQERALVPESRRVFLEILAAPQTTEDVSPPVTRLTAAVVGLSGLLAFLMAIMVESITRRRSKRRGGAAAPAAATAPGPAQAERQRVSSEFAVPATSSNPIPEEDSAGNGDVTAGHEAADVPVPTLLRKGARQVNVPRDPAPSSEWAQELRPRQRPPDRHGERAPTGPDE